MGGYPVIAPGAIYGRLTVEAVLPPRGGYCRCHCRCGAVVTIARFRLESGHTQSCGCLERENSAARLRTHGDSVKPLYYVWKAMLCRCFSPKCGSYKNYGARGITVCPEWRDFKVFEAWALSNGYDKKLTIERNNNDGSYSPDNCRWATRSDQLRNRRSPQRVMEDRLAHNAV